MTLPECMLPDGGDACKAYQELCEKHKTLLSDLADAAELLDEYELVGYVKSVVAKHKRGE